VKNIVTSTEEGGYVFGSVCLSVCLSVCPSDYSQTCERILTKLFGGVGYGSRTKWYNFGGDPDHASDLGVQYQSPKSGSSGSAEVCALWVLLVVVVMTVYMSIAVRNNMHFVFRDCCEGRYSVNFDFKCLEKSGNLIMTGEWPAWYVHPVFKIMPTVFCIFLLLAWCRYVIVKILKYSVYIQSP